MQASSTVAQANGLPMGAVLAHRTPNIQYEATSPAQLNRPGHHGMPSHEVSRLAYDLGWDMAHYGVRPRMQWPFVQGLVEQGWTAGVEHFGARTLPSDSYIKKWLRLRGSALNRGKICHSSVTPEHLRKIAPKYCPIMRTELSYDGSVMDKVNDADRIWSVDRLNNAGAYIAGNLVVMSELANKAKDCYGFDELQHVKKFMDEKNLSEMSGLNEAQWGRLTSLASIIATDDTNWRLVGQHPYMVVPPREIFIHGPLWVAMMEISAMPWMAKAGCSMGRIWMAKFRNKKLQKLAFEAADAYYKACFRIQMKGTTNTRWVAEDAWTNPAFQLHWQRFVARVEPQDLNGCVPRPVAPEDYAQWQREAGIPITAHGPLKA